jgi:hypothetical protein
VVAAAGQREVGGSLAAARRQWQRQGWCRHCGRHCGCGGFAGTICKWANAHAFECHRRANVHVFVLGQGRRDDSADGIVGVGSDGDGGARRDVQRGCQCAAAASDDAVNNDTAEADGDDIVR